MNYKKLIFLFYKKLFLQLNKLYIKKNIYDLFNYYLFNY